MSNIDNWIDQYPLEESPFFWSQYIQTGLPLAQNFFNYSDDGRPAMSLFMKPDEHDNVRFSVRDHKGFFAQYEKPRRVGGSVVKDWWLTRFKAPVKTTSGYAKYMPCEKGVIMHLLISPLVQSAFDNKEPIEYLYIIEGFKKALAAYHNGLPVIGMNGLLGFKKASSELPRDKQHEDVLNDSLRDIMQSGLVKNVVYVTDSDLFDMGNSKDKAETMRPNNFLRAVQKAHKMFAPYANVLLAHPKPGDEKLGLDDLLLKHRNISKINSLLPADKFSYTNSLEIEDNEAKVIFDLKKAVKTAQSQTYFDVLHLSSISDYKIKEYFGLDSADSFFKKHSEELQIKGSFRFFTHSYSVSPEGGITLSEEQGSDYVNIEARGNQLYRVEGINKITKLSNFVMRVLFQIGGGDDPKRIIEALNYKNERIVLELNGKNFVNVADFQATMIDRGDFIWKGKKDDLLDFASYLFSNETPAVEIRVLGWQEKGFWAWSNGIVTESGFRQVDENGIVTNDDVNYYIPAWSRFTTSLSAYNADRRFSHISNPENEVSFATWKQQLTKVFGNNGQIILCYSFATLFSDFIFSYGGIGFPLLYSGGRPQTGKSTICEMFMCLFGRPQQAVSLSGQSTAKYFVSRFGQTCNAMVHLEEFGNNVKPAIIEQIKNIFDRIGYGRKTFSNDNRTAESDILNAALISGEIFPTENTALFQRCLLMQFNQDRYSDAEKKEFDKLSKMHENGITHITNMVLMKRTKIIELYPEVFTRIYKQIDKHFISTGLTLESRLIKNAAYVITPTAILLDEPEFEFDFSLNQLLAVFYDNIEKQAAMLKDNTDMQKFWDIIEILFKENVISEAQGDYRFIQDVIAIRLNRLHSPYFERARKMGFSKVLDKASLENYLSSHPAYLDHRDNKGKRKQIRFKNTANAVPAYFFKYDMLNVNLVQVDPMNNTLDDVDFAATPQELPLN